MGPVNVHSAKVWFEVMAERVSAHAKHGPDSMEAAPPLDPIRLSILVEEVGEVAREFNEGQGSEVDGSRLRKELIQVAAMAGAWADAL